MNMESVCVCPGPPINSDLLAKIDFSRILELSPGDYDKYVRDTEDSKFFLCLENYVDPIFLDRSNLISPHISCSGSGGGLGQVYLLEGDVRFSYFRPSFMREYRFDEAAIQSLRQTTATPHGVMTTLRRMLLINSRNRLTHGLIEMVLDEQTAYLKSGDPLRLTALPQVRMARLLNESGCLPMVADGGRLSRLIRGLSIRINGGKLQPLRTLFPNERLLHCHRIDRLIKMEKVLLLEGALDHPLSDDAIAEQLLLQYGVSLSRRSVAMIRRQMAIPESRRRVGYGGYLVATEGFSALLPLTRQSVNGAIPSHPGVYEIRSPMRRNEQGSLGRAFVPNHAEIIYIGSTRDLRQRLAEHLRDSNRNIPLSHFIASGAAKVRYKMVNADWRQLERRLYGAFRETFGVPPHCNRMSP
ncbi:MAG: GIY-YIG nuclease family protein [Rhodospirillum sp.]|nr:GIY-YIG nuclease family protein [Rhodospirillum sp.]MCF8487716.1 GIY-YIG nuclease family protein [Rhodospirillum sp.]